MDAAVKPRWAPGGGIHSWHGLEWADLIAKAGSVANTLTAPEDVAKDKWYLSAALVLSKNAYYKSFL
jgi:hypothetical protein